MFDYKKTYIFPFRYEIPNYSSVYLKSKLMLNARIKYLKRWLYRFAKGQKPLEIFNITNKHKKILWINISAPSLGDSLMDLSSRILLLDKEIDLLTDKKNADLYQNDVFFGNVFTSEDQINNNYELVIIDSYSTRSIKLKTQIAPSAQYVGLYGFYNGPEVNRVLFSFHQMNNLTGYKYNEIEINYKAKSSLSISNKDISIIQSLKLPKNFIAIVIGGEWDYRTYNYWDKVIEAIISIEKNVKFVLIGSDNAKETEKKILEKFPKSYLQSYVAKFTFNQTAQIISYSKLLLCCDGGLMHAAISTNKTIVPLFARLNPEMQLTKSCNAFPLTDPIDVNNIKVKEVLLRYTEAINFDHNHHQF